MQKVWLSLCDTAISNYFASYVPVALTNYVDQLNTIQDEERDELDRIVAQNSIGNYI